jgi:multiple sugar transport system ATP-binding protein
LRVQMRAELKLLFDRLETTVVYVTHDQAEAMTMSDRVAIFDKGVVQQVGTPLELYNRPVNTFVAGFLGSPPLNFLEAKVADGRLHGRGFSFGLPAWAGSIARGTAVVLGIRPEDFTFSEHPGATPAAITLVEPMGSSTIVFTQLGENLVAIETDKDTALRAGSQVHLTIDPERIHVFDAATGRSLAPPP